MKLQQKIKRIKNKTVIAYRLSKRYLISTYHKTKRNLISFHGKLKHELRNKPKEIKQWILLNHEINKIKTKKLIHDIKRKTWKIIYGIEFEIGWQLKKLEKLYFNLSFEYNWHKNLLLKRIMPTIYIYLHKYYVLKIALGEYLIDKSEYKADYCLVQHYKYAVGYKPID